MTTTYPQETVGTTLVLVVSKGEYRRVYLRERTAGIEVVEFTKGPLTQELYDAPTHHHSIKLQGDALAGYVKSFFRKGNLFLVDLMDEFDKLNIPYGYLNNMEGQYVTYRPHGNNSSA